MTTKTWTRTAVVGLAVGALALGMAARVGAVSSATWAQEGFDARKTYVNPNETTIDAHNVAQLRHVWSARSETLPVVANGTVYAGMETFGFELRAYDATTGAERWRSEPDEEWTHATPVVAGGRVYATLGDLGTLRAYDAATGRQLWAVYTEQDNSPPLVVDAGVVYTSNRNQDTGQLEVCAFAGANGAKRWCAADDGDVAAVGFGTAIVSEHGEYGRGIAIVARDITDGHQLWRLNRPVHGISLGNGTLYGVVGSQLIARDVRSGALRWTATEPGATLGGIAQQGAKLYVDATAHGVTRLVRYDTTTGARQWSASIGGTTRDRITIANGLAYYATQNGRIGALDLATGQRPWSLVVGPARAPVIVDGRVYVTVGDFDLGVVQAYALANG